VRRLALPPPPSESCRMKLSPRRLGTSYLSTLPRTISPKCALTLSAVTSRLMIS
jgi:hypothetical protein